MAAKMGITERAKELQKAIKEEVPNEVLLQHLQALQSWQPDKDSLRATKLGVLVNGLRGTKSREESKESRQVAELAGRLVNKWKQDVLRKAPAATASGSATPENNGVKKGSSTSTPPNTKDMASPSANKPFTGDKSKRNAKTDGVNTDRTETLARNKIIEGLYKSLAFMSDDSPETVIKLAMQVESQMYNKIGPETSKDYLEKAKALMRNLKENGALRVDVQSGAIPASDFVDMTGEQLKSEKVKALDSKYKQETMAEAQAPPETRSISTMFKCAKCQHNKTYHYQAQTRSGDEPMTNFLECVQCGNEWKFSG